MDTSGNIGVAVLTVSNAIPETLPWNLVLLLSAFVMIAGSRLIRKPRINTKI
jgi:hypothetical protein